MADIEIYESVTPSEALSFVYQYDIGIYTGFSSPYAGGGSGGGWTPSSPTRVYTYLRLAKKTRLATPSIVATSNRQPAGYSSPFDQTPDIAVSEDESPTETQAFQYQSDIAVSEDESPTESGSINQ